MSGGFFDHKQYNIVMIADEVNQLIRSNEDNTLNEWGDPTGHNYNDATIQEFKKGLYFLRMAGIYAQRIDWLVSGDDGEDTFLERLKSDLEKHDE
jgi:hypothetical protein